MPWVDIYAGLAERHGWLPSQVDGLTLFQALVYLGARDREFGTPGRTSTVEEVEAYVRKHGIASDGIQAS